MLDGVVLGAVRLTLARAGAPSVVSFLLAVAYFTWMPVAYDGQTFGKMAAGLAVRDAKGARLTYGQCLGRYFGYWLSTLIVGAGFLVAAFSPDGRALHDYVCSTKVVAVETIGGARRALVLAAAVLVPLAGAAFSLISGLALLAR
jgi:uncharacterized RDD family membrane protein YckC